MSDSKDTDEIKKAKRLKELEERTGLSMDLFKTYFSLDGDMNQFMAERPQMFGQRDTNWGQPPQPMELDRDEMQDKKFLGKQYVDEVKQLETQRVKRFQIEEKERPSTSGYVSDEVHCRTPEPNPLVGRRRLNKGSMMSLFESVANGTDIESIGTCLAPIEDMEKLEDMSQIFSQYFGPNSRPKTTSLPITHYRERIVSSIAVSRVTVIEGQTGCGKTTQVPQYIADDCAAKNIPFNIVVTQPRRIAAKSIANRVADERGWQLGSVIGYQIGMDKEHSGPETRLMYCTTGVLLQSLIGTKNLDKYSHIIVDEVHERNIDTDLLLLVIKKLMFSKKNAIKLILMSATFDVSALQEYFKIPIYEGEDLLNEIIPLHIKVLEKTHPLNVFHLNAIKRDLKLPSIAMPRDIRFAPFASDPTSDKDAPGITLEAIEVAVKILEEGIPQIEGSATTALGAVLIFLPGLEEIHEMSARMKASKHPEQSKWKIYPLHSSIPLDKQNEIFKKSLPKSRKIILATNIAESSITVPDVNFVIDFCLTKNLVVDITTHIPVLQLEWASKANCQQRAGRTGRVAEGRVYRLVTEDFYKRLPDYCQPELVRSPLDLSILRVKNLDMGSPKELLGLALDPPDLSDIYHSVLQLKQVGAFAVMVTDGKGSETYCYYAEEDGDITPLGQILSHLPIDIRLGKLIVIGHLFDVLEDCILIAACLSTQGMFRRDFGQGLDAYKSRMAWANRSFSDSIACLNAYKIFKQFEPDFGDNKSLAEKWCKQNFIQHKRILEVDFMVGELITRLSRDGITIPDRPNFRRNRHQHDLILKVVMCAAFYPNYFARNPIEVENIPKQLGVKDPHNSVAINGLPSNEGPLYTQALRDIFSVCSRRIDIDFEDTKAYLTFLDDRHPLKEATDFHTPSEISKCGSSMSSSQCSLPGLYVKDESRCGTPMSTASMSTITDKKQVLKETIIKTAVYVAVAMRSHRAVRDLPKLAPEVTRERLLHMNKIKEEKEASWGAFRSHRVSVPHVISRQKLSRLEMPALDCSEFEIMITHIEDPTHFYAQYVHEITAKHLGELSKIISYELQNVVCTSETIRVGDLVIGQYIQRDGTRQYGRARVENVERKCVGGQSTKEVESVQIFYIDFGFTKRFIDLRELSRVTARDSTRLYQIPPQAFKCALSHVNPSAITNLEGCWSKKSIDFFNKWHKTQDSMTAKIYSVINRVVRLELFDTKDRDVSFNDRLLEIGFAEKWEESPQSKLNHEQRRTARAEHKFPIGLRLEKLDQKGVYNPDDIIELEIDYNPNERVTKSLDRIRIKGPHNPLECTFTGVSRQTSHRSVNIDRDSVNCVVLEADYLSKHSRLLVASSVGLSQHTQSITLRNTTLMPNIRGFAPLMALLFAPRVQLRNDKENKQYVGAICGLGYDKRTIKGYDPDYDAEIIFDTEISLQDVIKVDIIRYHISEFLKTLQSVSDLVEGSLADKQRKVRAKVIELLDRRRRQQDNSKVYPSYKWKDMSDKDLVQNNAGLKLTEVEINRRLLPLPERAALIEYDYYKDIENNLKLLKKFEKTIEKGGMNSVSDSKSLDVCRLCSVKVYTHHDLYHHVLSNKHKDCVQDFEKEFKIYEKEVKKREYFEEKSDSDIDEEIIDIFDSDCDDDEVSVVSNQSAFQ